ncbi:cytochrome c oxidase subunit 3 [Planctomycetaceae bacterium SH139]
MATTDALHDAADEHDGHHDHPAFLAHHFDTPEQQFDSGKLGMWLFLVTEVLFFSGLFCAYAIYRFLRPEVFSGSSVFLNTQLGAINTGVLLFSSLTMAWAVRCAQTEEHRKLTGMLAATISCATIFLGVKAIEYSHKIELGLLPAGLYSYNADAPHHAEGISIYLVWMCVPFAISTLGLLIWYAVAAISANKFQMRIAGPLLVSSACFFVGVGLGSILESGESDHADHGGMAEGEGAPAGDGHNSDDHSGEDHSGEDHSGEDHSGEDHSSDGDANVADASEGAVAEAETQAAGKTVLDQLALDPTNTGVRLRMKAEEQQRGLAGGVNASSAVRGSMVEEPTTVITNPQLAGVFFSIYYCMTGIHAIHILAGIGVLVWLLIRSVRLDFNRQYFGPVDYVGLYWHIVDLIWIYLFPLLYLIR